MTTLEQTSRGGFAIADALTATPGGRCSVTLLAPPATRIATL